MSYHSTFKSEVPSNVAKQFIEFVGESPRGRSMNEIVGKGFGMKYRVSALLEKAALMGVTIQALPRKWSTTSLRFKLVE